jgi:crotonobetainyl-CoA:carnitine CoA-transferase CaiB-like acyl-CoA transferase
MFKDLNVVELAGVLAGPAVGAFFAELGATVVKIENPATNGDVTRHWKLPSEDPLAETSAYFASVNYNKNHLFLSYDNPSDLQRIYALLQKADIVICNWKKGDAERFKLDYETISNINPGIIYAAINSFGEEEDRVAFDVVLQAETGWMYMNGSPSSPPTKVPVAIIDLFAAHQLKEGVLTALIKKLKTGQGSKVSVSLFDVAVSSLANQAANYLNTGEIAERIGSLHPNIAPYGEIITFKDGEQVVLAIGSDKQFKALCQIVSSGDLCSTAKYATNAERVKNRNTLIGLLQSKMQQMTSEDFVAACRKSNIPVGIIRNMKQLFELDRAKSLILTDSAGKRVKSVVFKIEGKIVVPQ